MELWLSNQPGAIMKSILTILCISITLVIATSASAKPKKSYNRADFTEAQKAEIFKRALALCRKKYGDQLHNAEVNYTNNTINCLHY
jgi:hypothetical protein